jgi:hypothetical protein
MEPVEGVKLTLISMFLILHLFCLSTYVSNLHTLKQTMKILYICNVMPVFHIYQGVLYLSMFNIMNHQNAQSPVIIF